MRVLRHIRILGFRAGFRNPRLANDAARETGSAPRPLCPWISDARPVHRMVFRNRVGEMRKPARAAGFRCDCLECGL